MDTYNEYIRLAESLTDLSREYSMNPTKTKSKKMRELILRMQQLAVEAKRDLIAADKGE